MKSNAVIIFTRVPVAGKTKTRLMPYLNGEECALLHETFIKIAYENSKIEDADILIFFTPRENENILKRIITDDIPFYVQEGHDLGEKMENAFKKAFSLGYKKAILIGTDIPLITKKIIKDSFDALKNHDIAINPTKDGGYYLIGMKENSKNIFNISHYGENTVIEDTLKNIKSQGLSYFLGEKLQDVDTKEDLFDVLLSPDYLKIYLQISSLKEKLNIPKNKKIDLEILGAGEYNLNYKFIHPVTKKPLVLRINTGSQMHLENQIEYEFNALKILESSKRTPKVYFYDDSRKYLPFGVLVMEFLEGKPLNYETDLEIAASILSDIHSLKIEDENKLLCPLNPLRAMHEECVSMASNYLSYKDGNEEVKIRLERLILKAEKLIPKENKKGTHLINTELNSGNFLINGKDKENYLIDWEKPILGEVEQDLAHFLSPTTTFWKTDTVLTYEEMEEFLKIYKEKVNGRFSLENLEEKFKPYLIMTTLRGITWCAMAYVEYEGAERAITNEFTFKKIKAYLDLRFLDFIEKEFYKDI